MEQDVAVVGTRAYQEEATQVGLKARFALMGPTGAGKTWTSLDVATHLVEEGERIMVIDTERGSARNYARAFKFAHMDWKPPYHPGELAEAILELGSSGKFGCLVVDSLSHFWKASGGTLDQKDRISARGGANAQNSYTAWNEAGKLQDSMIEAILSCPVHIICTMRSKMAYAIEEYQDGNRTKTRVTKVGLAPVQRDDTEYEFTVIGEMDLATHRLVVTKSRIHDVADQVYSAGQAKQLGIAVRDWLAASEPEIDTLAPTSRQGAEALVLDRLKAMSAADRTPLIRGQGYTEGTVTDWVTSVGPTTLDVLMMALRLPYQVVGANDRSEPGNSAGDDASPATAEKDSKTQVGESPRSDSNGAQSPEPVAGAADEPSPSTEAIPGEPPADAAAPSSENPAPDQTSISRAKPGSRGEASAAEGGEPPALAPEAVAVDPVAEDPADAPSGRTVCACGELATDVEAWANHGVCRPCELLMEHGEPFGKDRVFAAVQAEALPLGEVG